MLILHSVLGARVQTARNKLALATLCGKKQHDDCAQCTVEELMCKHTISPLSVSSKYIPRGRL